MKPATIVLFIAFLDASCGNNHISMETKETSISGHLTQARPLQDIASKTLSGNCAYVFQEMNRLKSEQKKKDEEHINKMVKDNAASDADAMVQLQVVLLEVDYKLCKLESNKTKTEFDEQRRQELMENKQQIQNSIVEIEALKAHHSDPKDSALLHTEIIKILSGNLH
ncbi:hypothetical protein [Niabella aurantiaca]|uniref:hypothetical protein n=1 Tax=Niabella aurantiaca TaxID=379900 RepID=UPI000362F87F|nr:hypothetical protein [Niabella aurantiaca]